MQHRVHRSGRVWSLLSVAALMMGLFLMQPTHLSVAQAYGKTITVNSIADPGNGTCNKKECTLREAIKAAPSGGTIKFDLPDKATITLDGKQLILDKSVTIDASDVKDLQVNGDDKSRIFEIWKNATVTIKNLTMTHGETTGDGGNILSKGKLTLDNSIVQNGDANQGGGIRNMGMLTLKNKSTVKDNDAKSGGGISNSSKLTLDNSTVKGNEASGNGGGIWNSSKGMVTGENATVQNNKADRDGGGIWNAGKVTLDDSMIRANESKKNGGGIHHDDGMLTISDSMIRDNEAKIDGGGVYIPNDGTATIERSTFRNNEAGLYGGGLCNGGEATVNDTTFRDNEASQGGGIWNFETLAVNNSTVSGNEAKSGGGIFNRDSLKLNNVTVTNNNAKNGGGLYNQKSAKVQNSILAGNVAPTNADCRGKHTSLGYNLVGKTCSTVASDLVLGKGDLAGQNIDDVLKDLSNNGGPTETHALVKDSPAIDAGNPKGCTDSSGDKLMTDQRGKKRPVDGDHDYKKTCDIGSYELQ
ncbi:MAG: choice-of-anchor Q domain-containing protein [Ardenticatenaceae bacterium]